MARTVEETIMRATIGSFAGPGKDKEAIPEKSYMAIATSIPKVGEHYKCQRLENKASSRLCFRNTETTTVQKVHKLAGNVYVVTTRNSYYITRVLGMPDENVQFAVVKGKPVIGSYMKCRKMVWEDKNVSVMPWETTTVQEVEFIKGLYKVKTRNTIYVCFPVM